MFWFKILRRLTIPKALTKLRAKASVEVMLWNALWIWATVLQERVAQETELNLCKRWWLTWQPENSDIHNVCLSPAVNQCFRVLCVRRSWWWSQILVLCNSLYRQKKFIWTNPPKFCSKVRRIQLLCHLLQLLLHFYHKTFISFMTVSNCFLTVCAHFVLSHQHPVLFHAFLLACCYFSLCINTSLLFIFHIHIQPVPPFFTAPKSIWWTVLASPCLLVRSSSFCFSYF